MELPSYITNYFDHLNNETAKAYALAKKARAKGYDPALKPEIQIAKNMAERVVGLVSVAAPQLVDSGIVERIQELEAQYGILDWRVAMVAALEVAQQKYCTFEDKVEAIEVGIRVGFAYVTNGVVSSPLEGLVKVELGKRNDGKGEFFRLYYAGPVRNAGGTAASVSALIGDYVRTHMGYATWDPTDDEINRCYSELGKYHDWIANLQFYPSQREITFLVKNMPIDIAGDPTEKVEVGNYKNLPRVNTNKLRAGYCLMFSGCIPLKAPKLWKQLAKWGDEMGMGHWKFLEEYMKIQKEEASKSAGPAKEKKEDDGVKITPNFTYIKDLVAGRPVFAHPLRPGGFRLRYGRSRLSGFSGQGMHPASMIIANEFIATASQLKVERPGKATAYTVCDRIDGPIVRLKNGDVVRVETAAHARELKKQLEKILYLGDTLCNYGDFLDRAHVLVPPGYCEEWWVQELKKAGAQVPDNLWNDPSFVHVSFDEALKYSKEHGVPLHPRWTYFYNLATTHQLRVLWEAIRKAEHKDDLIMLHSAELKAVLELLGVPHKCVQDEYLVVEGDDGKALRTCFSRELSSEETPQEFMAQVSPVFLRDKAGIFVGARLGRPEKAKMRKLTGSPHGLFPCGGEGGRLRSINEAYEKKGVVTASFEVFHCPTCDLEVVHRRCPVCDGIAQERWFCKECGTTPQKECNLGPHYKAKHTTIEMKPYFEFSLKRMNARIYPDLIKGVRGTMNQDHATEHITKALLRARHEIHVNKDGTVRYDASEVPITHFRPSEIGISAQKTRELGYEVDIHGAPIESADQVIEMFPQDVVLPACEEALDEGSDKVLLRTAQFVDELLAQLYDLESYYNAKTADDLIGHFVVALAPHTSAGTIGRIIGFTKTQGLFYHPYLHAATRRDCFTAESIIPLKKDGVWRNVSLGSFIESLQPTTVVDSFGTLESRPSGYSTLGLIDGNIAEVPVNNFTKHTPQQIIKIHTKLGTSLRVTVNHKQPVVRDGREMVVFAKDIQPGDKIKRPYVFDVGEQDISKINFLDGLGDKEWLMVRGLKAQVPSLRSELQECRATPREIENYTFRDCVPAKYAKQIVRKNAIDCTRLGVSAKRDSVVLPCVLELTDDMLSCIGLYIAEGYARHQKGPKGSYQFYISGEKAQIRNFVKRVFAKIGLRPSENKTDRVTYSSRIMYELFTSILGAGSHAYDKRIPARLMMLPKKRIGKLLGGYFEGDGSVSKSDLRITFDTVSKGLREDLSFVLGRFGVFVKYYTTTRKPGKPLREFYMKRDGCVPSFTCTKGIIQSKFFHVLSEDVQFVSSQKMGVQQFLLQHRSHKYLRAEFDEQFFYDEVTAVQEQAPEVSYCLNVPNNHVVVNNILTKQCDGDEGCVFLMMDAFLNFSRRYLPSSRGGTMDAPLVLTTVLEPAEVDDMILNMDITFRYPLEFYQACMEYKMPWDVKIKTVDHVLGKPGQWFGMGFTHDTTNMNDGNRVSSYKTLPSMQEKLESQMDLAEKIVACDERDVARLVIEKHFIRDLKGNLRKFSMQVFRCVKCNDKYRRPPLRGNCHCGGRIIFTISEGSVVKYLTPAESLVNKYDLDLYLRQTIELTRRRVEEVFGKDPEKQLGLGEWF